MISSAPSLAAKSSFVRPLLLACGLMCWSAVALITRHGREPLGETWTPGVTSLVNHPARVGGLIGPLAPAAQFYFSGDTPIFNDVLTKYSALTNQERVLYVVVGPAPITEDFKDGESHDFDLQITIEGKGFLILYTGGRVQLEEVKLPPGVAAELSSGFAKSLDPAAQAAWAAEEKRVRSIISRWRQPAGAPDGQGPGK